MVPTWTQQCCDMRDIPSPWGATATSKAVWTGKGCHRSQCCSWSPLYCRSRWYPKAIISGTTNPWVKSTYFSLPKQAMTDGFTFPCTNLCANLWGFSCPDYSWGNNLDTPQTLSYRLSKKAFHFLSEDCKRTSDGLETCPLVYDLCK